MANKDLDKEIRDSFESSAPKAPQDMWSALAGSLSAEEEMLDQKLKESFESEASAAPEAVWQGINRQLTIDKAWVGINRYLNRKAIYKWSARIAAILLLAFGAFWFSDSITTSSESPNYIRLDLRDQASSPKLKPEAQAGLKAVSPIEESSINAQSDNSSTEASGAEQAIASNSISNQAGAKVEEQHPNDVASAAEMTNRSSISNLSEAVPPVLRNWHKLAFNLPSLNLNGSFSPLPTFNKPKSPHRGKRSKWELGFEYSFNRDFLSNNVARESQDPRSLVNSNAVYSNNYKIVVHYRWHPQWTVKLGFQPQRNMVLNYNTYREGQYVEDELSLNFHRLGLGLEHHIKMGSSAGPWRLNLGVEPYYAYLAGANNLERNLSPFYRDSYGMQFRLGQEFMSRSFILSYGLETDFNLNNLYRGNGRIPADFDQTLYRSWGFYVGLRYRL